jgi:hypothetical protein
MPSNPAIDSCVMLIHSSANNQDLTTASDTVADPSMMPIADRCLRHLMSQGLGVMQHQTLNRPG